MLSFFFFFFQAEDGIRDRSPSRGLGDVYKRQDQIYVQLKQYETEIKQSNRKLETMFEANVNYYHELVKYILAGEQGCQELEAYIAPVSYTHLRAHETDSYLVCRLLLEKKKQDKRK